MTSDIDGSPHSGSASRLVLRISGRVQGVFFRQSTARVAAAHDVRGWVRNLPDGDVEVVLEGPRADVESVLEFCRVGPRHAVVTGVEVREEEPAGATGFEILP
ncbi:MAG: acylphosphatase [Actinobacteria bacterium ATB1]|nr:acylphosphatase [Actinobacteria bacterium ATB1]